MNALMPTARLHECPKVRLVINGAEFVSNTRVWESAYKTKKQDSILNGKSCYQKVEKSESTCLTQYLLTL